MLVDLLRVSGGEGAELLRRWVAALMAAPPAERRGIVEAIEARIVEMYDQPAPAAPMVHIESEPTPGEGFTEVVVRSFAVGASKKKSKSSEGKKSA